MFRVRFTLSPRRVRIDPETFETTLRIPAASPGEEGWLLFRDALWRGEANDGDYVRRLCADRLPVGELVADPVADPVEHLAGVRPLGVDERPVEVEQPEVVRVGDHSRTRP